MLELTGVPLGVVLLVLFALVLFWAERRGRLP